MGIYNGLSMLQKLTRRSENRLSPDTGYADELLSAIHSLRAAGMSRRGISELLRIHEEQVRQLLSHQR